MGCYCHLPTYRSYPGSLSRSSFNWITTATVGGLARFFCFCIGNTGKARGAWRVVLIFSSRKVEPQPPLAYQPLLDSPWIRRVYLEDVKDRTDLSPGLQSIQLIVADPDEAVSQASTLLHVRGGPAADPNWPAWLDLIETILMYKLPQLSREEIQRMLHLPEVELKQTRFYQDVFAEGHAEGRTEGRTEGRAEGRAEGQQQEAAALVLRQLRRRLGTVPADAETQIRALPVADLEALGESLLDWQTPAELLAWLQRHRDASPL